MSLGWGMRSGAENSLRMDLERVEMELAHLRREVEKAIQYQDLERLPAALKARATWRHGGYVIDEPKEPGRGI